MLAKYSQKQLGNPRKISGQPVAGKGGREGWGFRKMDRDFKFKPEHVTHMRKKTREKVGASSKYVYAKVEGCVQRRSRSYYINFVRDVE